VYYNKGKAVPATINVADKFDDEESWTQNIKDVVLL
jgi:hypothetical protein